MHAPIVFLLALVSLVEARVTFPYSEVLQAPDLVNNAAAFNCDYGCKVYVDRANDYLRITQNGNFLASFTDIVGNNSFVPDGIVLQSGKNYKVQATRQPVSNFVLYAVSSKAPSYGLPVAAPQGTQGISFKGTGRYQTLISSFNLLEYNSFSGSFAAGYPKIYTTGYDAVGDTRCKPVYQGRTQYNVEQSRPVIVAPIVTVDFGYSGQHSVIANQGDGSKGTYKSPVSSTVYMSPGYVGCSFTGGQQYYSSLQGVTDNYKLTANSLDINAVYTSVATTEPVNLRVNNDVLTFYGTSSNYKRSYSSGSLDISLSWQRKTSTSSWAMQLDFGAGTGMPGTTSRPIATTSSASSIAYFVTFVGVFVLALIH